MLKLSALTVLLLLGSTATAFADCPSAVPGTTVEAIRANEQRVICLQREIANNSQIQKYEIEINRLDTSIQRLELQRRFDNLPRPMPIPVPVTPKF